MVDARLHEILDGISEVSIAVYGDFYLDAVWHLDNRSAANSSDGSTALSHVVAQHYSLAGAANVAANIAALNPRSLEIIGVIGGDAFGQELLRQLAKMGVDPGSLLRQEENFNTQVFIDEIYQEEVVRKTAIEAANRSAATDSAIINKLREALKSHQVLVICEPIRKNSYCKKFTDQINQLFQEFPEKLVLVDSHHAGTFENVYHKTGHRRLTSCNGPDSHSTENPLISTIGEQALKLHHQCGRPVFVTVGENGILTADRGKTRHSLGIRRLNRIDASEAGDTILGTLSLALAAGATPFEAAELSNLAAAATAKRLEIKGTASAADILQMHWEADRIYEPDLAADPRLAKYHEKSEIEICDHQVYLQTGHIKHAVFDYDGTISVVRQGWEEIMAPVMVRAILGERYETAPIALMQKIKHRVIDYIDKSTGVQTIIQMEGLVEMVSHFGMVPKDKILDAFGYKSIFNRSLTKMVEGRISRFEWGQLGLDDLTIKGAVSFLRQLRERGVKLYLASGTDRVDILKETQTLGIAHLFDGGIFGSVGDITKFSKRMVVNNIIKDNQLQGHELAVFGDGPVEIQVCRRFDGIAVGIASDEIRRYGLDAKKRVRLINAGARMVIPDFCCSTELLRLLFKEH